MLVSFSYKLFYNHYRIQCLTAALAYLFDIYNILSKGRSSLSLASLAYLLYVCECAAFTSTQKLISAAIK